LLLFKLDEAIEIAPLPISKTKPIVKTIKNISAIEKPKILTLYNVTAIGKRRSISKSNTKNSISTKCQYKILASYPIW
jgi:hypothetical protein